MLIDSHCHLTWPSFVDCVHDVVLNMKKAGVEYVQTVCTKSSDVSAILELVNQYDNIFGSVGIHPLEADKDKMALEKILLYAQEEKIIGIGETGLDFYKGDDKNKICQIESFLTHITASKTSGLPLIIHSRNADIDMQKILQREMMQKSFKGLLHCFTGGWDLAERALDLNLYISISGIITFSNASDLRSIVKKIPLSRLLIETDAPYLAPVPYRGKLNQPAFIVEVAKCIAEVKGISFDVVCKETSKNFFDLFDKAEMIMSS
ncbi:TatD family hydrolase [Candidatus Sneabacter namystus]|uniref:TatD family deoxyribonuclease n=1 Tax=Candidatus Sneabacter namystus TaxID=2601646 RepID=A0A5C0UI03_9RICK|nr:TatD family hydrolase [Candidatus Sneabacter namystus]QEK39379.1 TatD family deoxyribonuclease [Candidatus Sneabacter namystus]